MFAVSLTMEVTDLCGSLMPLLPPEVYVTYIDGAQYVPAGKEMLLTASQGGQE
jgi:hypothetical protein